MAAPLPEFDLERYLPYRFTVIAGKLSAELAKAYKVRFGISMPEWRVLVNVGYTEDLSVRDIERRVSLEKSKVSRAVTKLEAKGYLVKQTDTDDRRLLKLTLTDEGTQLLRALIPIAQALQDDLNAKLADATPAVNEALDILMEPDE